MIADVFKNNTNSADGGTQIGMPVLYYRADTSKIRHDPKGILDPDIPSANVNIYTYADNQELVGFFEIKANNYGGINPDDLKNPLWDPVVYYKVTLDKKSNTIGFPQPYRKDSFILISAGFDALYGTRDDICNFKD